MDAIKIVEQAFAQNKAAQYPEFKAGDTITVVYKVKEGDKERLQKFRGVVIQISGATPFTRTFTVRKVASGVGVERIFPFESPFIDSIELNKTNRNTNIIEHLTTDQKVIGLNPIGVTRRPLHIEVAFLCYIGYNLFRIFLYLYYD